MTSLPLLVIVYTDTNTDTQNDQSLNLLQRSLRSLARDNKHISSPSRVYLALLHVHCTLQKMIKCILNNLNNMKLENVKNNKPCMSMSSLKHFCRKFLVCRLQCDIAEPAASHEPCSQTLTCSV